MLIPTPKLIDAYIRQIPEGKAVDSQTLRKDLALQNGAEVTCPLTTGIFLRIVAEAAQEAYEMGMVNAVIPHAELEDTAYEWAQEILGKSPTAIKMLKFAFNLTDDGMVGQQVFAGEATRLTYMTEEAKEGRDAFLEKRKPNFRDIKWIP